MYPKLVWYVLSPTTDPKTQPYLSRMERRHAYSLVYLDRHTIYVRKYSDIKDGSKVTQTDFDGIGSGSIAPSGF